MRHQIKSQPEEFWRAIRAYSGRLKARGNEMRTRQHSELRRWKATGSQQAFREVERNLRALCQRYPRACELSIALRDYCQIVEKNLADAREEACGPPSIQQWKAMGEASVLSGVVSALTDYLERYLVGAFHVLAADGQKLAALWSTHPFQSPGPFPLIPEDWPAHARRIIAGVEDALERQSRALVKMEPGMDNAGIALAIVDRLLQYTRVQRVLFLTEASLLAMIRSRFLKAISHEDGRRLSLLYPAQELVAPLQTSLCFATLRQVQLHVTQRCEEAAFDAVILYNVEHLTTPWVQILSAFTAPLIGFSSTMSSAHCAFFQEEIITADPAPS